MAEFHTGYEETGEDYDENEATFELVPAVQFYSQHFTAQVLRNGVSVGLIYCADESEFNWLKKRINGVRNLLEVEGDGHEKSHNG